MRVSLIGMSNIGKTYWARRIASSRQIKYVSCDALIERQLEPELKALGYRGLRDVAKWMGQPADAQYAANSARYVACEKQVMREIAARLRVNPDEQAIIDTTGSVIYAGPDILGALRQATKIVYLEASEAHIDGLFRRYLKHPKPVIWGDDAYAPRPNETAEQTLQRCYLPLLRERTRRYREIADITIPFERHKDRTQELSLLIEKASNA